VSKRYLVLAPILVVLGFAGCAGQESSDEEDSGASTFEIGLIGDFPYDAEKEVQAESMFDQLNGEELAFIVHDGDIKSGSSPCEDGVLDKELERFEGSENPLIYTPGDNEWTDCHRTGYDPNERLQRVRETFFTGGESFGKNSIVLTRQSEDYPENARWSHGGVTFATLHVVGGNNGLNPDNDPDEHVARNEANLAWLEETFEAARENDHAAVMLAIQANVFEEDTENPSGFADFKEALRQEVVSFGRPVVLVHGDSHNFRIDKPLYAEEGEEDSRILNFTRVETFGEHDVHWVRASVGSQNPEVLTFRPEIIEENATQ
jgi:hypothetical protein